MLCPRCQREQEDGLEECRHCGVIFSRWRPRPQAVPEGPEASGEAAPGWRDRLLEVQAAEGPLPILGQGLFLALLALVGIAALAAPVTGPDATGGFLHWIDLPFHEAGHVVFSPFGDFVHILGGTLGQLLVPLIVAGAFLRQANPYGASVGVWWFGQSLVDCAPYIADARARVLPLISGATGQEDWEGHDWFQMLSRTGLLGIDTRLAKLFWLLGALAMAAALAWGVLLVRRRWLLSRQPAVR